MTRQKPYFEVYRAVRNYYHVRRRRRLFQSNQGHKDSRSGNEKKVLKYVVLFGATTRPFWVLFKASSDRYITREMAVNELSRPSESLKS